MPMPYGPQKKSDPSERARIFKFSLLMRFDNFNVRVFGGFLHAPHIHQRDKNAPVSLPRATAPAVEENERVNTGKMISAALMRFSLRDGGYADACV